MAKKDEITGEDCLYFMGCMLILGFLIIAFVFYMIVIPIVAGIIIIICIITRTKKKRNWKSMEKYEYPINPQFKDGEETKLCFHCGKEIPKIRDQCPYCHMSLITFYKPSIHIKQCPNCNMELTTDFCQFCGWKKPKKEYKDRPTEYYKPKPKEEYKEKRSRTIPKAVQREVWRRDGGRCVECGTKENLEYDHIIPWSKGGSNTTRNIQLLCEKCNRSKHNKI